MKKCPNCNSVYSDDTLSFCLSDGTPLDTDDDSEKTLPFTNPLITDSALSPDTTKNIKPSQKSIETAVFKVKDERKGVSPIWIYSTVALLFSFIGGGLALFLSGQFSKDNNSNQIAQTSPTPQISPSVTVQIVQKTVTTKSDTKTTPQTTETPPPFDENATYKVVKVAANDFLFIRPAPGNTKSSLGKIPPDANGIKITGKGVKSGKSVWYPIDYNGTTGWVSGNFLAKE